MGEGFGWEGEAVFWWGSLIRPLLLVLEGFALVLVFDLSIAISLSRWSFRSSKARTCKCRDLFSVFGGLLGQVPVGEGSLLQF